MGIAFYRYHYLRFPPSRCTRATFLNAVATAFFDEAVFRGICSAAAHDADEPNLANLIQALLYALATRLGAPGRPWYMLAVDDRDRPRQRLADRRSRAASARRSWATRSPGSRSS